MVVSALVPVEVDSTCDPGHARIRRMNQADRIRQYALEHYVLPARAQGRTEITIRAGDVHRAMGLRDAMPSVCNAIGFRKFFDLACVTLVDRAGPPNGANVYFCFALGEVRTPVQPTGAPVVRTAQMPASKQPGGTLDLREAVVLVSCVKSKRPDPAPAGALYTSAWFVGVRDLVEASGAPWHVLSSRYGLVAPTDTIAPYDSTLNSLGVAERQSWALEVLEKLFPLLGNRRRVVMFAGLRYREFLVEPLLRRGIAVDVPMAGLRRREQLAWLASQR